MPYLSQFGPAASVSSGIMGRSAKLSLVFVIVIVVEVNSSYMRHDQDASENNIARILFFLTHM